jgi:hypothetical protein
MPTSTLPRRGPRAARTLVFESLAELYATPARWRSPERDVGLRWRGSDGATYRAAWIRDTEELYCVRHVTAESAAGTVEVLARVSRTALDSALAGWQDVCGEPGSYEWLRERAAAAPSRLARQDRSTPPPSALRGTSTQGWPGSRGPTGALPRPSECLTNRRSLAARGGRPWSAGAPASS